MSPCVFSQQVWNRLRSCKPWWAGLAGHFQCKPAKLITKHIVHFKGTMYFHKIIFEVNYLDQIYDAYRWTVPRTPENGWNLSQKHHSGLSKSSTLNLQYIGAKMLILLTQCCHLCKLNWFYTHNDNELNCVSSLWFTLFRCTQVPSMNFDSLIILVPRWRSRSDNQKSHLCENRVVQQTDLRLVWTKM